MATCAPHTVLLVEDDGSIRQSLAEVLEEEGYAVIQAKNGQEAIERLHDPSCGRPCLIILDLMMPVMDGFEFRNRQVRDSRISGIPVVALSADTHVQTRTSAMHIADSLRKPISLDALLATVERHCL